MVPTDLKSYIVQVGNVMTKEECEYIIREVFPQLPPDPIDRDYARFIHGHLTSYQHKCDPAIYRKIHYLFSEFGPKFYAHQTQSPQVVATQHTIEPIRIKRYVAERGDHLDSLHYDCGDLQTCKRYLAMIIYLNDVPEGGRTMFPELGAAVIPVQGSLMMFPPGFQYMHKAEPVTKYDKYTLQSFLLFSKDHPYHGQTQEERLATAKHEIPKTPAKLA